MAYDKPNETSVTEVLNKCPRIWEYYHQIQNGELDYTLPIAHKHSARGKIVHLAVGRCVNHEEVEWDYGAFMEYDKSADEQTLEDVPIEMFNAVRPDAMKCYYNAEDYISKTEDSGLINYSTLITEHRLSVDIGDDHLLTGKPDGFNIDVLLDWKSGKPNFMTRKQYIMQLGGYALLINLASVYEGVYFPKLVIDVFLGGSEAEVVQIKPEELNDAINRFSDTINYAISMKKSAYEGIKMQCKTGFLCSMCSFAGLCRGI